MDSSVNEDAMDTTEYTSTSATALGSPVHWHLRALPHDVQRGIIRRLALSGLQEEQIAARTGLSVENVRRAISEDDCLRHLSMLATSSPRSPFAQSASSAN
jgi:hypothetical protein